MSDNSAPRWGSEMLSVLRIVSALIFLLHGSQKLFGVPATDQQPPLMSLMGVGGVLEFVGGLLLLVGFLTRPVAFVLSGMMAVAYFQFHAMAGGLFPMVNGGELAALYCWVFLYLVFAGPGALSVDGILAKKA